MQIYRICNASDHNIDQCPSKAMSGSCPSREIIPIHIVQTEVGHKNKNNYQFIMHQIIKINTMINNII
jgi:hypothetical protein